MTFCHWLLHFGTVLKELLLFSLSVMLGWLGLAWSQWASAWGWFFVPFIHSFIHTIGMCRMQWYLAILRSFFHSSLLCTFTCHPSPPTILPSSLTSSCHPFLGLPVSLVVSKFIYNSLLGILFSSILCTCQNQLNLFNLIVSVVVGFLTIA